MNQADNRADYRKRCRVAGAVCGDRPYCRLCSDSRFRISQYLELRRLHLHLDLWLGSFAPYARYLWISRHFFIDYVDLVADEVGVYMII
jgi:hypothetical protein